MRARRKRLPKGWVYDLEFRPAVFRAQGLDAAHRVSKRVEIAIQAALALDPECIEVEQTPLLTARSSPKNVDAQ
jgi:hypothetical protein